jgi:peptidoglycan/xylan/chitin deacetylase (PgdA/CDA1 family)
LLKKSSFLMAILTVMLLGGLLVSCTGDQEALGPPAGSDDDPQDEDPQEPAEPVDYEALGVNELGQIMFLMYHEIGEPEAEWVRTPDNFRKDLQALYEAGYRAVSLNDVLDGNIDVPAGTTPVVITFDDSTPGQFRFIEENGRLVVDPDCAVGILEEFHRQHPDFGLAATFFIIAVAPFGQEKYVQQKLDYLVEKGFEIGSHTYSHPYPGLGGLSPEKARQELAYFIKWKDQYLPDYRVRSLALPYGTYPKDMSYIIRGEYEGIGYHNEGIFLVGANPAPSPFSGAFRPEAIPRVRASEMNTEGTGIYDQMQRFQENLQARYISDGDPNTVVIPEKLAGELKPGLEKEKTIITY